MNKQQASGMAGVYYVAAELSRRGYTALVTTRNARAMDIVAINDNNGKSIYVQVKTLGLDSHSKHWLLGAIDKQKHSDTFIYVFVKMYRDIDKGIGDEQEYYIVPADLVRKKMHVGKASTGSVWYYIDGDDIDSYHEKWDIVDRKLH